MGLLVNSFHHTPFLIGDISYPIRLPCRNQYMRTPSFHMPIQLVVLINLEPLGIVRMAALAITIAILAVHRGIYLWEQTIKRSVFRRCSRYRG
jgi:hypothetical protein